MITAPRAYRAGVTEKLRVQLFDTKDVWNVSAKLVMGKGKRSRVVGTATGQFSLQTQGLLELKVRILDYLLEVITDQWSAFDLKLAVGIEVGFFFTR